MKLISHIQDYYENTSACWGYASQGREYAIYGHYTGTSIVDITNDDNIHEVGFIRGLPNYWREMKVFQNYLYVVSEAEGSGLQIIDLSYLPDSIHLVRTFFFEGFSRAHTISQNGPYLYLNGGNYNSGGITVLDLSADPVNPVKLGEWEDDYVHDSRIVNDTIWACNPLTAKISVINAIDKNNLQTVASWSNLPLPAVPHNCALTQDRKYIFVTDEIFGDPGKIKIWNIENINDITLTAEWNVHATTHSVHNVEIYGNYAVIAYYGEGVRILDITHPANPVEIAWYKTLSCWGVYYFNSGKIIASDIYNGLYVLTTKNPIGIIKSDNISNHFSLSQNYPNPFNPSTNIKFDLQKAGFVKLIIYDALGREVTTLVNSEMKAGSYNADWDASSFASGIYFYKLEVAEFVDTKKMVLIK